MAGLLKVSPTRMELTRLKNRLKVAQRGHKLLKDKRDEMVRQFMLMVRENRKLRIEVEKEISRAMKNFLLARAMTPQENMEEAIMFPTRQVKLKLKKKNIMSVYCPVIDFEEVHDTEVSPYPYSFASSAAELDEAIETFSGILPKMLALAEKEKSCQLLADEIEKTRRRVNALEHVMIPQMQDTIKYIAMKLDEDERGARIRLMKVKEMISARELAEKLAREEIS